MAGPPCTVCAHAERDAIDREMVAGSIMPSLAKRFGLSQWALYRHRARHLPERLSQAADAAAAAAGGSLLEQVRSLQERTLALLDQAEAAGRAETALRAVREARRNLELLAKLLSELNERPAGGVLLSPEWLHLRGLVVAALAPYPEARLAVVSGLRELEGERGAGD